MKKSFRNITLTAMTLLSMCQFCLAQINTNRIQTTVQPSSIAVQALQMPSAWVARHNLNPQQYQAEFDNWTKQGYRPTSISGYTKNGQELYAVIFEKKSGVAWVARHGLNAAQYQAAFDEFSKQGYRPTIISGYSVNGQVKFAAVFEKKTGSEWIARHNLTAAQYQATFDEYTKKGFYPAYINAYMSGNQELFACVFEKGNNPVWAARHGLNSAQYQAAFNEFTGQGYYPKIVSGYNKGGTDYFAAVFIKPSQAAWASRHAIGGAYYQGIFDNMYYQGYRPVYVNGYASGGAEKMNALWENTAMNVNDIQKLDKALNDYRAEQGISALSVAICKDERLVFAKGYGAANSKGEEVNPNHTMRIMSVSKPVTSVGIMTLVQQGKLSLDAKVFGAGGLLNAKYPTTSESLKKITVKQLLWHTSGLETCNGQSAFWKSSSTIKDAMDVLMNDPNIIKYAPNMQWYYSNTGYFFLGRIIEEVSGQTYENFIRSQVLNKCGIGNSMYLGNADGTSRAGEVEYVPESKPNMQLWGAFGGWVARPIDLLKFLVRVEGSPAKPDILTAATHTTMVTGSSLSPGYAFGWSVSGAIQSHNGCHGSSRSFLVELSNGISYAIIISNAPKDDGCSFKLKAAIEEGLKNVSGFPNYDLFD
jgi:CubicO group peptidase (beta-lactamase class C family)